MDFNHFVTVPVVHVLWHFVMEGGYHALRDKFAHRALHNHDVQKAMRESYSKALLTVYQRFREARPTRADAAGAAAAYKALRSLGDAVDGVGTDRHGNARPTHALAPIPMEDWPAQFKAILAEAPDAFAQVVKAELPEAFAFAFTEIGLKGDARVRAVLTQDMLQTIHENTIVTATELAALSARLDRIDVAAIASALQSTFAGLGRQVRELHDDVKDVKTMVNQIREALAGDGPLLSRVNVYLDGRLCVTVPLKRRAFTIGRSRSADVQLPDSQVSGTHARVELQGALVRVRDLKSENGVFIDGVRLTTDAVALPFGKKVGIGPYVLEFLSPRNAAEDATEPTEKRQP
jgi:hypothetical protein